MNTQTRLGDLALACWIARHCGSAGKWERKTNVMRARVELRRAQRDGVYLWNVVRPFGIEFGVMKWRSVA